MDAKSSLPLRQFFDEVYRPRRLFDGSKNTIAQYEVVLRHFSRYLERPATVADLTEDHVTGVLAWLSPKRKSATVANTRQRLLALANYAHKRGLLAAVPDVRPIRIQQPPSTSYTIEELTRLLDAARNLDGQVGEIPARMFWPAFFLVAINTGARAGALWSLEWRDFDSPYLHFRAECSKTRKHQCVKISGECIDSLKTIRKPERSLIFPGFGYRIRFEEVRLVFVAAGLPHTRRDLLQRIRRSTATLAHRYGADATAQLGHSSDAITRKHYLDSTGDLQAADVLPKFGRTEAVKPADIKTIPAPKPAKMSKKADPNITHISVDDALRDCRASFTVKRNAGELCAELLAFSGELSMRRIGFVLAVGSIDNALTLMWTRGPLNSGRERLDEKVYRQWQDRLDGMLKVKTERRKIRYSRQKINAA